MHMSSTTTWTCYCGNIAPEGDDLPDLCPRCGGVWVRPVRLTYWQTVKDRIRRRFEKTHTFNSVEELIAWLEEPEDPA